LLPCRLLGIDLASLMGGVGFSKLETVKKLRHVTVMQLSRKRESQRTVPIGHSWLRLHLQQVVCPALLQRIFFLHMRQSWFSASCHCDNPCDERYLVVSENQICLRLLGLPLAPKQRVTQRHIARNRLLTFP